MTTIAPDTEVILGLFHAFLLGQEQIVIKREWLDRMSGHANEIDVKVEMDGSGNLVVSTRGFRQVPPEA